MFAKAILMGILNNYFLLNIGVSFMNNEQKENQANTRGAILGGISIESIKNIASFLEGKEVVVLTISSNFLYKLELLREAKKMSWFSDKIPASLKGFRLTTLSLSLFKNITKDFWNSCLSMPISKLTLSSCSQINDDDLESLKALPIKDLILSNLQITDSGLFSLEHLPINQLTLHNLQINSIGHFKNLSSLEIRACKRLASVDEKNFTNLKRLVISANFFMDNILALSNMAIKELKLQGILTATNSDIVKFLEANPEIDKFSFLQLEGNKELNGRNEIDDFIQANKSAASSSLSA